LRAEASSPSPAVAVPARRVYAQQANRCAGLPVGAEESADLFEDLGIEIGGARDGMGAGDGGEVGVTELELERAGLEFVLPDAAAHHFGEPGEGGFDAVEVGGVLVEGVLVTDGFGAGFGADFRVEPAPGIEAAGFAGEGEAPLAEALFEESGIEPGEVADTADTHLAKAFAGHFADAGDAADVERGEDSGLHAGLHPEDAVGLGLV
jgi:hypothetical protein